MVIVAGAQENLWPDLRSHQTILQADRIGKNEVLMPPTFAETLAGERRLFYVAVTRAMQKLVLTAVDTSINDDGVQPSRFLRDIQAKLTDLDWQHIGGRPKRPLNVDGLVSSLRRVLMDANSSPELKTAAASRLAKIGKKDSPVFKNALPENWWGINEITKNEKAKNNSVALSATAIENIELCSLRWFLERKVGAISDSSTKMIFGNILHLIAAGLQNSEIPTDLDFINTKIDQVWPELGYEASWESTRERQEARDASVRLLNWFIEHNENESLAETQLALTKSISDEFGNDYQVNITGFADRVEFTVDGVMIYDFKTSKKIVKKSELAQNVQLALYSYLFENGNYKVGDEVRKLEEGQFVQGAALIQLRNGTADLPEIQLLKAGDHDDSSDRSIETRISEAAFVAANEIYETKYDEQTCKFCAVRTLCPATTEGRQVQL
jgi:RecB family exonuclease